MKSFKVKILQADYPARDIIRFKLEKPKGYPYISGRSATFSITDENLSAEKSKPMTFTSIPSDNFLEVMVKRYPEKRGGVANYMYDLKAGEYLYMSMAYGKFDFKGKGTFIAGGIGITPFVSMLRSLSKEKKAKGNKLIISAKTFDEIPIMDELRSILGEDLYITLTQENHKDHAHGRLTKEMLEEFKVDFKGQFYLCGPDSLKKAVREILEEKGVDKKKILG
jgi:ferredoxin-NADP reductase